MAFLGCIMSNIPANALNDGTPDAVPNQNYSATVIIDFTNNNKPDFPVIHSDKESITDRFWEFGWPEALTCTDEKLEELQSIVGPNGKIVFKFNLAVVDQQADLTRPPFRKFLHKISYQINPTQIIPISLERQLNNPKVIILSIDSLWCKLLNGASSTFFNTKKAFPLVLDQKDMARLNATITNTAALAIRLAMHNSIHITSMLCERSHNRFLRLYDQYKLIKSLIIFDLVIAGLLPITIQTKAFNNYLMKQVWFTCGASILAFYTSLLL